jgi:hypothetical protein
MPATLTTKDRPRVKVLPERRPPDYADLKKNIVLFMLGASMTLFAFWLYGGHSCTADIIRDSTPHHIFHQEYYGSGAS